MNASRILVVEDDSALSQALSDTLQLSGYEVETATDGEQTLIQETASMERLSKLVARQERQQEKIAKVEALFTENEAMVLRQGDAVILRMVGLNFDTGSAVLKPEHTVLLGSLERAINEFPESNIVVEGHTDAFGSV